MAAVKIGHTMQSSDQSQQPCEPKTDAKHQGVAKALDELQIKKHFGGHWSLFEEAHGDVRGGKHRASFQEQIPCKLQVIIKNALQIPGEF